LARINHSSCLKIISVPTTVFITSEGWIATRTRISYKKMAPIATSTILRDPTTASTENIKIGRILRYLTLSLGWILRQRLGFRARTAYSSAL
jgi:hypothetical protein